MNCKNMIAILNTVLFQPSSMYFLSLNMMKVYAHFIQTYFPIDMYTICSKLMHFNRVLSSNQGHVTIEPVTVV